MAGKPKDGIFTPLVEGAKALIGEDRLKKYRAEIIKAHGGVMGAALDTSDSQLGQMTLKMLFEYADADGSGELDEDELRAAMKQLGFEWLDNDKKMETLMKKGDKSGDGLIDFEEFKVLAPTCLNASARMSWALCNASISFARASLRSSYVESPSTHAGCR